MSDNVNLDEIIQKKLLYKFDKLLNRFTAEYMKLYRGDAN